MTGFIYESQSEPVEDSLLFKSTLRQAQCDSLVGNLKILKVKNRCQSEPVEDSFLLLSTLRHPDSYRDSVTTPNY